MLVRYFVEVPLGIGTAHEALLADPTGWIPELARQADANGAGLLARVGFGARLRISKEVRITLGAAATLGEALYLPISWQATGPSGIFPILEGTLEVAPLDEGRTQMAISASYTPPLDGLGAAADRALLHRVAEATMKDFLDRVARRLAGGWEASKPGPAPAPPSSA
jgi:hypothetical protein